MKKSFRILSAILSIVIVGILIITRFLHGPIRNELQNQEGEFMFFLLLNWTLMFSVFTEIPMFYDKRITPLLRIMTTLGFIVLFIFINQMGDIISIYSDLCVILIVVAGGARILAEIISLKKTD